jgi:hypothetical protein
LQSRQQISDLIHEDFRKDHQPEIDSLAEVTTRLLEVSEIQVPSGGTWFLTRPLTEAREDTMHFVIQTARALTDAADELLVEIDKLGNMEVPKFVLGKLPEPDAKPPKPVPQFDDSQWQSPQEREFILQLCQDAGKDFNTLSDQEQFVLQMSLENYRSQFLHQRHVAMGHTTWTGEQA